MEKNVNNGKKRTNFSEPFYILLTIVGEGDEYDRDKSYSYSWDALEGAFVHYHNGFPSTEGTEDARKNHRGPTILPKRRRIQADNGGNASKGSEKDGNGSGLSNINTSESSCEGKTAPGESKTYENSGIGDGNSTEESNNGGKSILYGTEGYYKHDCGGKECDCGRKHEN